MADEYIERETLISALESEFEDNENCRLFVSEIPTADVVEVQHGYWYNINHYQDYAFATCSICKESGILRTKRDSWGIWYIRSPYCPNCGAKMDGGKE